MAATAWCAPTTGHVLPAAITARDARSRRPSPPCSPTASTFPRRCGKPRTTPGTPSRRRTAQAWASSCPIGCSGRAKAPKGRARQRPCRAPPMPAAIIDTGPARARNAQGVRGLYAITPDTDDTAQLAIMVQAAVRGGARVVQYRNKVADAAARREQALAIKYALTGTPTLLIINDDVTL